MNTALLIIGDEILNGDTLDTNSNFAARLLNENGINVSRKLTVADKLNDIKNGLEFLLKEAELVITTGGLGPTKDDITKQAFAEYFNCGMVEDENVLSALKERFARLGRPMGKLNESQAMVPEKCEAIINPSGTAPVMWFEQNNKVVISLPGVPYEMRYLLENVLLERIKSRFVKDVISHRVLQTIGLPESVIAEKLASLDEEIERTSTAQTKYKLAYLPQMMQVRLRLTGMGNEEEVIKAQLDKWQEEIKNKLGDYIYAYVKMDFPEAIGELLKGKQATISTAESCTGGYLSHLITSISGSSEYYKGSVISYANEVKIQELGVSPVTIKDFGAVSEECCHEMVSGALKKFGTTYAIATTGIAGPGGESEEKPVGSVWIGIGSGSDIVCKRYNFNRNRVENIHIFAITALTFLRQYILDRQ